MIIWLFIFHQDLWLKAGIFITLIYSIYANLATDYGAISSALAPLVTRPRDRNCGKRNAWLRTLDQLGLGFDS